MKKNKYTLDDDKEEDIEAQIFAVEERKQELERHGYSSEDEYNEAYFAGETGGELGEPSYPEPEEEIDDLPPSSSDNYSGGDKEEDIEAQIFAVEERKQELERHGYSSEDEYNEAYFAGETGGELGEPSYPEPEEEIDDLPPSSSDNYSGGDKEEDIEAQIFAVEEREQELERHGYSSEDEYNEAYFAGETGGELGEPSYPEPEEEIDDLPPSSSDDYSGGGDEDYGGGDEDSGGGDEDYGGGDEDSGGGDEDYGGGDEDYGGGDEDYGGGDEDYGGGDW